MDGRDGEGPGEGRDGWKAETGEGNLKAETGGRAREKAEKGGTGLLGRQRT